MDDLSAVANRLNDSNRAAARLFMKYLADWQDEQQDGKILVHVNTNGIAHKIDPTPSIVVKKWTPYKD